MTDSHESPDQMPASESSTPPQSRRSRTQTFWFALKAIEVRLRIIAILVAIGLVIGYWDTIQNYWDHWTRPATVVAEAGSDTEYYCPMDPSVIRDGLDPGGAIPKCPICGMPLSQRKKGAPVELPAGVISRVSLSPEKVRMAGIMTSELALRPMTRQIRAVGTVAYNESARSQIVTRVGGFIEKLYVDRTYQRVRAGDPLAEIYSPELYAAIQELRVAQDMSDPTLVSLAREKIQLMGIDDREIDAMAESGEARHRVIVRSPTGGVIIQKMIQEGSSIDAGAMLFDVADLSTVWIEADIYERDIGMLTDGQAISARVEAIPHQVFQGRVSLIYPEIQVATRTNRVRFEVENSDELLRIGMYATVELQTPLQQVEPFQSMLVARRSGVEDIATAIARQAICPVTGAPLGSMGDPVPAEANGETVYLCCAGCTGPLERNPEYYLSRIHTVTESGVLAVPETAVIDTGMQKIVYIEREDGVFEGVEVEVGPKADGFYSVISGLLPGDRVAAAGAFLIDAETRLNPAAAAAYFGAQGSTATPSSSLATPPTAQPKSTVPSIEPPSILPPEMDDDSAAVDPSPDNFTDEELANIVQLNDADQSLARLQVLCPITEMRLGSMGVPLKISVKGEAVLICCKACENMAKRNAEDTLAKVNAWKETNQTRRP